MYGFLHARQALPQILYIASLMPGFYDERSDVIVLFHLTMAFAFADLRNMFAVYY